MRTALFLPNWIGDVCMATPALDSIRATLGPADKLIGVMRPYVSEVLAGSGLFDEEVLLPRKQSWNEAARQVATQQPDRVVLMTNSFRTAYIAWASGAKERIGYARDFRSPLLTTRLYEPKKGFRRRALPPVDSYLNLAYVADGPWRAPQLKLGTTAEDEAAADHVWQSLGLPTAAAEAAEASNVIVLNTGGAYGAAKSWPVEHYAELAQRLTKETPYHVLVNCGPAERETARDIVTLADRPQVHSLADFDVPIGLSKACIKRSRLLVTSDSGPRFFGIAFERPVVSIFGPTGFAATNTHYAQETPLSLELDCQPCMARTCPLGHHRCMKDLSVNHVEAAVMHYLDKNYEQKKVA